MTLVCSLSWAHQSVGLTSSERVLGTWATQWAVQLKRLASSRVTVTFLSGWNWRNTADDILKQ